MLSKIALLCSFLIFFSIHAATEGSDDSTPVDWRDFLQPRLPLISAEPLASKEEQKLLEGALLWAKNFQKYAGNDIGFRYFHKKLTDKKLTIFVRSSFEEDEICSLFSQLRCATGFAMAVSPHVQAKDLSLVFSDKTCQKSEAYQVFVAANSYDRGRLSSEKLTYLQQFSCEDPTALPEDLHAHHSDIFTQMFPWLQQWEASRHALSYFFEKFDPQLAHSIFDCFMYVVREFPYVLHHLETSDFQQYAYVFIPVLCNATNLRAFSEIIRNSCPFDPNKKEILTVCDQLSLCLQMKGSSESHEYCASLANTLWTLFASLNAHVTQDQWELCVAILRDQNACVNDAFTHNYGWIKTVFEHRELPQTPSPSTTCFSYYKQHHAPYIFERHARVINDLYQMLEKYCSLDDQSVCRKVQKNLHDENDLGEYDLLKRDNDLRTFLVLRCRIVWGLAKKGVLSSDFLCLHSACTSAEKRALSLNSRYHYLQNSPCKTHLQGTAPNLRTEDLSRLSISMFIDDPRQKV